MPKMIKIFLFVIFPVFLLLGVAYGLAKIGVIPVRKFARTNRAARLALHLIGLDSPTLPAVQVTPAKAVVPTPLESERKALDAPRSALESERAKREAERQSAAKTGADKASSEQAAIDPKSISRLATVYEQMPTETANKIFAKLPDPEVIALLRKMDEKKVAQLLAIVPPDRAARMTLALSKPAAAPVPAPSATE